MVQHEVSLSEPHIDKLNGSQCLSVCLSVCLSACLYVCIYVCTCLTLREGG